MTIIELKCPHCGANIEHDTAESKLLCEYCGYRALVERTGVRPEDVRLIEEKSYAKARGEYRAQAENQRSHFFKTLMAFIVVAAILVFAGYMLWRREEAQKVELNPFDHVSLTFSGITGEGVAKLTIDDKGKFKPNEIQFQLDKDYELSEGDTVTITAQSEHIRLLETEKKVQVEGLDLYLLDLDTMNESSIETFHTLSLEGIKSSIDISGGSDLDHYDAKPVMLYFATDGDKENILFDVFEVTFTLKDGSTVSKLMAETFSDVIARQTEDGSASIRYNIQWGSGKINLVKSETMPVGWLSIYDTLAEVKSNVLSSQDVKMTLQERDLRAQAQ